MSKYVTESHIIGERGVNAFADYCNRHVPYLIWKETTKNDFGIDGEVEISALNSEGKLIATGEIIKIQIKSTLKGSYIHDETDESFYFLAKQIDIDYWKNFELAVILIVYDDRTNSLFAKKISELDLTLSQKNQKIIFDKKQNLLEIGKDNFVEKFSNSFKKRINYEVKERIETNLFNVNVPRFLYNYKTDFTNKKDILENFGRDNCPIFVIRSDEIYTFIPVKHYPSFKNQVIKNDIRQPLYLKDFLTDSDNRNIISELIYIHTREFLSKKAIAYNKKYNRYYFSIREQEENRQENYISRFRRSIPRNVVIYRKYKVLEFYRHLAYSINILYLDEKIYLIIDPKYLYTSDGVIPLENKKLITSLTNYVKQREHNPQILNHSFFLFSYLKDNKPYIPILEFNEIKILIRPSLYYDINFGIPIDSKEFLDENEKEPTFTFIEEDLQ